MEFGLLVALCRIAIFGEERRDLFNKADDIDWNKFTQLATHHRVRPLVYFGICKSSSKEKIPNEIIEKLKSFTFQKAGFNLNQTKEVLRVLKLFEAEKIRAIPYKGVVLAQEAYDNIAAREFSDIDLMIEVENVQKAKEALQKINYEPTKEVKHFYWNHFKKYDCELSFVYKKQNRRVYQIDLHWFIGNKMFALNIGNKELLPFITKKQIFNTQINSYSMEGILLTTCLHHIAKEHYLGLKHICDIAAILQKHHHSLNWDLLLSESKNLKIENYLLIGIGLANEVFTLNLPKNIRQLIESKTIKNLIALKYATLRKEKFEFGKLEPKNRFFKEMWHHINLRKNYQTKLNIWRSHIALIFHPNENDYNGKEAVGFNYFMLILKKPFRLLKQHF